MKICEIYKNKKILFSCEVFPPKPGKNENSIFKALKDLKTISPDFISVTYGTGGNTKEQTIKMAIEIKNTYGMEPLMHLTCINTRKEEIVEVLDQIEKKDVENILCLRGDIPDDKNLKSIASDFSYASDLIQYVKPRSNKFCLGVAGYPEIHPEASSMKKDIDNLKKKIESGGSFIISQLFFKNELFYRYLDTLRKEGISAPVSAGIMPVFKAKLLGKMVNLSRAKVPSDLASLVEKYKDNDMEMEKAGIEYAAKQIRDLKDKGIDGIHLYIMNRASIAKKISSLSGLR
jgi:methylenetetrahydrofolate reductase (NADPH)